MQESCTKKVTFLTHLAVHFVNLHLVNLTFRQLLHLGKLIGVSLSLSFCYYEILRFRNFPEIKIEFCKNLTLLHYEKKCLKFILLHVQAIISSARDKI